MPPEENKKTSQSEFSPLRVDIDPIFRGATKKEETQPTGAYNLLNNQEYKPNSTPNQTTNPELAPQKKEGKTVLRTYKDDIADAIKNNHLSSINIAIAENEKMHNKINQGGETNETNDPGETYSKNKIILFVSVSVIILTIIVVAIVYFVSNKNTTPTTSQVLIPAPLITTEYKDELNINNIIKDRFVSALSSKINDIQIPVNNTYNTYITTGTSSAKRLITTTEFITLANLRIPDIVKRTLAQEFMIGMFSFGQDLPFVIFKTSSFENAYAGMLEWEKYLEKDFTLLFRLNDKINETNLATTSTSVVYQSRQFEDGVIVNKDVRLLRDSEGKTIFLYGILNKDTIVITVNEASFKELITRLNREKSLKR